MSVADAAKVMQVSERTIRRWMADGRAITRGRQVSLRSLERPAELVNQQRHARPNWAELLAVLDSCQ